MSWLRDYLGTITMALLLAVLTWAWLYSEGTMTRQLGLDFDPQLPYSFAEKRIEARSGTLKEGRLELEITGPRAVVEPLRDGFRWAPQIPARHFGADHGVTETIDFDRRDIPVPLSVTIKELPKIVVHYVKWVDRTVTIDASPADIEGELPLGYRVSAIRPRPRSVAVRMPSSLADSVGTSVPIRRVAVSGRSSSFETLGALRLPDRVTAMQSFFLEVVIEKVPVRWTVEGVELNLAGRDELVRRLKLRGPRTIHVTLQGPEEFRGEVVPSDLFAFVRVPADQDLKISPITLTSLGCEITNARFRGVVQVEEVMSEAEVKNRQAEVEVVPEK